jgi:hypothetical protein
MNRWFRPVAWSIILVLLALAIFGSDPKKAPPGTLVVPIRHVPRKARPAIAAPPGRAVLSARRGAISTELFAAEASGPTDPAPALSVVPTPLPPVVPADLKILGWMQPSGGDPMIFVECAGETYTLSPRQVAGGAYRFEKIGAGQAEFTFLPTGEARQYAVSDPAVLE